MIARIGHALGVLFAWIARVVTQVGGALNGGRSADDSARKLYEQPRDDYHP